MGNRKIRYFLFGAVVMFLFVSIKTQAQNLENGKKIYQTRCLVCHQADGGGVPNMNAPLDGSTNVVGNDIARLVKIIKNGFNERVELDGLYYSNSMTPNPDLTPAQISDVLSYIRTSWSNKATKVTIAQVQQGIKGNQKTSTK
ncbi:MAG: cytochrome c [Chitinophagia bacterium]|jgi:mono/diheme cytochrome c family protein|nr:cytochrome c [Chitinophagia bacterium]